MSDNKVALDYFANLIESEIGILYREDNYYQLEKRLADTAQQIEANNIGDLLRQVKSGNHPMAKMLVLDAATNNETSFFRDKRVFDSFLNEFLPEFSKASRDVRVWSAAASTGQEIYTLAMCLEQWKSLNPANSYNIFATDISGRVLNRCEEAEYSQLEVQRGLPAPLLIKWFDKIEKKSQIVGDTTTFWAVKPQLKNHINFAEQNLLQQFDNQGPFDIVFCRNVLIYFDIDVKKDIITRISKTLAPGGILVLGASESMIGLSSDFDIKKFGNVSFYRKKESLSKAG